MINNSNLPADVAADSPKTIAKAELKKGGAMGALVPETLDDAFRLSKALALAGNMVPDNFQGKPDSIMAAVLRGMEIGLAPMQALSSIAVINGRSCIWGDALPALMLRAGHHIDVSYDGAGDELKAVATLTRGDTGAVFKREFSVADAKTAKLWGKSGPWQTYPKRMLSHRARSWAVRDGAADTLMGLQIAEEVQDQQPMRDVTPEEPKATGFAAMARNARAPQPVETQEQAEVEPEQPQEGQQEADGEPQGTDAPLEGEILPDEAEDQPQEPQEAEDWPFESDEGATAFREGKPASEAPYQKNPQLKDWMHGWATAREQAEQDGTGQ